MLVTLYNAIGISGHFIELNLCLRDESGYFEWQRVTREPAHSKLHRKTVLRHTDVHGLSSYPRSIYHHNPTTGPLSSVQVRVRVCMRVSFE